MVALLLLLLLRWLLAYLDRLLYFSEEGLFSFFLVRGSLARRRVNFSYIFSFFFVGWFHIFFEFYLFPLMEPDFFTVLFFLLLEVVLHLLLLVEVPALIEFRAEALVGQLLGVVFLEGEEGVVMG